MIVRPTTDADLQAIAELTSACNRALAVSENYTAAELAGLLAECSSLASIRRQYAAFTSFVSEQAGTVIGVVAVAGDEIAQLFVAPHFQHQGIGRRLVSVAEAQIRACGHAKARVYTASAPAYYQPLGYVETERRRCTEGPLAGRTLVFFEKVLEDNPKPN